MAAASDVSAVCGLLLEVVLTLPLIFSKNYALRFIHVIENSVYFNNSLHCSTSLLRGEA